MAEPSSARYQIIDGDIWVRLQDLVNDIGGIAEKSLEMAEITNIPYMAIQAHGIAETAEGLQAVLDKLRKKHGLTPGVPSV